jgi:hypothetical protein
MEELNTSSREIRNKVLEKCTLVSKDYYFAVRSAF